MGSQPCKRKRLTEVLKAPKPSPVKTDSCNPFHNRTQDRTKERENCTVLDLGISKDREWAAKAPRVGLLNTYCAGKRPRTGWSTRLSILKKTLTDATLRLCQWSQLTLPPLNRPTWLTTRSSNDRWEVVMTHYWIDLSSFWFKFLKQTIRQKLNKLLIDFVFCRQRWSFFKLKNFKQLKLN